MKKLFFISSFLVSLIFFSCNKNSGTQGSSNLISNSSFEIGGDTSFQGWTGSSYSFVNDTIPNGGQWALQLIPEWYGGEGYAEYMITGLNGNFNFNLNCMVKCINWHGFIALRIKNQNGTVTNLGVTTFTNTTWNMETLNVPNLSLQSTDQLIVHLSAGATEIATGQVLFDLVKMQTY